MSANTLSSFAEPDVSTATVRPTCHELWEHYSRLGHGSGPENELVKQYLPLVKTVVGRLAMTLPPHVDIEDLYSAGLIGLLNAVRRYDPGCGTTFETYARVRIRGTILDELRHMDWVPRSVHDKARKVVQTLQKLEQKNGKTPTETEMAKALEMSLEEYEDLLAEIRPATFVCLDFVRSAESDEGATQYGLCSRICG